MFEFSPGQLHVLLLLLLLLLSWPATAGITLQIVMIPENYSTNIDGSHNLTHNLVVYNAVFYPLGHQ